MKILNILFVYKKEITQHSFKEFKILNNIVLFSLIIC